MSLVINIYYTGKNGSARKFAEEMVSRGIVNRVRAEDGNEKYEYFFPMEDNETVMLIDKWKNQQALDEHHKSEMMQEIAELRNKYELKMRVEKFTEYEEEIQSKNTQMGTTYGGAFGMGEPNVNYAQYFIGNSYLKMLDKTDSGVSFANVTFEPKCRNNWHIHKSSKGGGQVLICVEGEGWYQEEGKEARSLKEGDIVVIPANVKHWHGAKKDSWFSHIAVEIPGENASNEWCEPVTDEEYNKLN